MLALWSGETPPSVQQWLDQSTVESLQPLPDRPDIEYVETGFLLMMGRYLRRHAGIGLPALVRQPGKVATTPAWVDFVFDQTQADIRVRKAGIDIDPGWIPWLGKVVRFHYEQSEVTPRDR